EMNRGAGNLHPGAQRLSVRIETGKRRQERRVDVEHAALPAQHELCREQPHEAAETDELHPVLIERCLQHPLERGAVLAVLSMVLTAAILTPGWPAAPAADLG